MLERLLHNKYIWPMLKLLSCLLLLILAASSNELAAASKSALSSGNDDIRCRVAIFFINNLIAEKPQRALVFSDIPEDTFPSAKGGNWFSNEMNQRVAGPPVFLLNGARKEGGQSAIQLCSSVKQRLRAEKISFGAEAVENAINSKASNSFDYAYNVVGVSLPVVSATQDRAVLYSSQTSGPLIAGRYIFYLKKDRKRVWRIVASKVIAVS